MLLPFQCLVLLQNGREAKGECAKVRAALDKKRSKLKAKGKDKKELKRSLEVACPARSCAYARA